MLRDMKTFRSLVRLFFLWVFLLCIVAGTTQVSFAQVVLNEIEPAPSTGAQWFELLNTSNKPISLRKWKIENAHGEVRRHPGFTLYKMQSGEHAVFEVTGRNQFDMQSDHVQLLNAEGGVADDFSYSRTQQGLSWARIPDGTGAWQLTTPTRGQANIAGLTQGPTPTPTPSPAPTSSSTPQPTTPPTPPPTPQSTAAPIAADPQHLQLSVLNSCPSNALEKILHPLTAQISNPDPVGYALKNWHVMNQAGKVRRINQKIGAGTTISVTWLRSFFNQSGDVASLLTNDGLVIAQTTVPACQTVVTASQTKSLKLPKEQTTFPQPEINGSNPIMTPTQSVSYPAPTDLSALLKEDPAPVLPSSPPESDTQTPQQTPQTTDSANTSNTENSDPNIVGSITASPSATEISVPTASTATTSAAVLAVTEPQKPSNFSTYLFLVLLAIGIACFAAGAWGLYRWWQEKRQKETVANVTQLRQNLPEQENLPTNLF